MLHIHIVLDHSYDHYRFGSGGWSADIYDYLHFLRVREVIKPDTKKVQVIMDISRPSTTTEAIVIIGMVYYYRDMWHRRSHVLDPLTEATSGPKDKKYCGTTQ